MDRCGVGAASSSHSGALAVVGAGSKLVGAGSRLLGICLKLKNCSVLAMVGVGSAAPQKPKTDQKLVFNPNIYGCGVVGMEKTTVYEEKTFRKTMDVSTQFWATVVNISFQGTEKFSGPLIRSWKT